MSGSSGVDDFAAAALLARPRPRVVHQDPPHGDGNDGQEAVAILGGQLMLLEQPEVDLVDEGRSRQRVIGSFAMKLTARNPAQLVIDQRDQPVDRLWVARTPLRQTLRHLPAHKTGMILARLRLSKAPDASLLPIGPYS